MQAYLPPSPLPSPREVRGKAFAWCVEAPGEVLLVASPRALQFINLTTQRP